MAISDLIPWNRERAVEVRRGAEDPFWALHREMNRMFEDFARGYDWTLGPARLLQGFEPQIDVRETEDAVLVTAEMPGLEEKDFELELGDGVLTLRGEKRSEHEEKEKGSVHHLERSYGSFRRSVALPCEVEAEKANAIYRKGVLEVTLPKAPEARRPVHRIAVKSGA